MRAFTVLMGIVVVLCVVVSATFAFEFGWLRGATPVHQWTYALAGVALDLLKSGLPIFAALAWAERKPARSMVCWFVFVWLTALSLWAAYATTATQIAEKMSERGVASAARVDAVAELGQVRAQRQALPAFVPTTAEGVTAAREAVAAAERARSAECDKRGPRCRERETDELVRRGELTKALADQTTTAAAAALDARIATAEASLKAVDMKAVTREADPQSASMAKAIGASQDLVAAMSHAVFAIAIELGSGVGFWLVFGHGAGSARRHDHHIRPVPAAVAVVPEPAVIPVSRVLEETPADIVERFFLAAVRPARGERIQSADLRAAYEKWCGERGRKPLSPTAFGRLASWRKEKIGGLVFYLDCRLAPPYAAQAPRLQLVSENPSHRASRLDPMAMPGKGRA
jgi:hypothetical protein